MEQKVILFINDKGEDKKILCIAEFSDHGVTLSPLDKEENVVQRQFSWDQLKIFLGGANDKLLFFEFEGVPNGSFYIEGTRKHLGELSQIPNEALRTKLAPYLKKRMRNFSFFYGSIIALVFALGLLWTSRGKIAEKLTTFVPYSVEQQIGEKVLEFSAPELSRYNGKEVSKELALFLEPVLKGLENPENYQFFISRSGELNAFALPGGFIVINKGLIDHATRPEEVLGVVAHEIGHAYERHVLKNFIQASGAYLVLSLVLGDVEGIIGAMADQGSFILSRKFSRDFERRADEFAFNHLHENLIDPSGMADFFEKLLKQEKERIKDGDRITKALSFISTHPDTESRIQKIRQKIAESGIQYKPVRYDLNKLKDILK